jgi:prophage antirepressor-like protein
VTALQIFSVGDSKWRFGRDGDGAPWAVASDVAKSFDYRDAASCARIVDEDEKGIRPVDTPGGTQQMIVLFEDGLWELIFLSQKIEAKAIKKRVKAILKEIRETGSYSVAPVRALPRSFAEALRALADENEAHEATRAELTEARPAADAWNILADAKGDYSLREAAQILDRDPFITTGQNRLSNYLQHIGWTDKTKQPYQAQVDAGRLVRRPRSYTDLNSGESKSTWQIRITAKGLKELRSRMSGQGELFGEAL